jgi:hypothetical protein
MIPLEESYGHLLAFPFHDILQKVKGCVVRLLLYKRTKGYYQPRIFHIKKYRTCQSESCLVKTIFIIHRFIGEETRNNERYFTDSFSKSCS